MSKTERLDPEKVTLAVLAQFLGAGAINLAMPRIAMQVGFFLPLSLILVCGVIAYKFVLGVSLMKAFAISLLVSVALLVGVMLLSSVVGVS